jgi:hypothetical protein
VGSRFWWVLWALAYGGGCGCGGADSLATSADVDAGTTVADVGPGSADDAGATLDASPDVVGVLVRDAIADDAATDAGQGADVPGLFAGDASCASLVGTADPYACPSFQGDE